MFHDLVAVALKAVHGDENQCHVENFVARLGVLEFHAQAADHVADIRDHLERADNMTGTRSLNCGVFPKSGAVRGYE